MNHEVALNVIFIKSFFLSLMYIISDCVDTYFVPYAVYLMLSHVVKEKSCSMCMCSIKNNSSQARSSTAAVLNANEQIGPLICMLQFDANTT